ncbi:hypothetical protein KW794_00565 [Candidatus Saccharibacteria bacterium]|nr:hypothetical protein [Candidatus Saccharibacteria bacterium]
MRRFIAKISTIATGLLIPLALPLSAKAATTITVTPTHNDGWATADTRPGGAVQYVYDPSSPAPDGALQLITDSTTTSKAQYLHTANTALTDVTNLSYYTKQNAASFAGGDPSYQLITCLGGVVDGACIGFTTLVYEPYQNGTVTPHVWQSWDVDAGLFWSTRSYSNGSCTTVAGAGGAPFYTLSTLQTTCPNATVVGFGVNIGSNNPSYVVETDLVAFNDFTYDFQLTNVPSNKDDCKNNGYQSMTDENGNAFKNQGQCVSYFNRNSNDVHTSVLSASVNNKNGQALYNGNSSNGSSNNNNNTNSSNTGTY